MRLHCRLSVAGNGRLFPYRDVDSRDFLSAVRMVLLCNGKEKIAIIHPYENCNHTPAACFVLDGSKRQSDIRRLKSP